MFCLLFPHFCLCAILLGALSRSKCLHVSQQISWLVGILQGLLYGANQNRTQTFSFAECFSGTPRLSAPPMAIADRAGNQRSQPVADTSIASTKNCFLVSDRHSITIADFGFSHRNPIVLRGSTQTLATVGTLGCANLCWKKPPRQKTPDRVITDFAITIGIATLIARSGALSHGISQQNPGTSRQKVCVCVFPWPSRDPPNFSATTPSRGRPPPHQKMTGHKILCLCSCFWPDCLGHKSAKSKRGRQKGDGKRGWQTICHKLS